MFSHKHYVPILKGRDGEYGALSHVSPRSKSSITPLLELPPIPWDFEKEAPARSIDAHLKKVAQKIEAAWGANRPFFLDFLWIAQDERMSDGRHPVAYVFATAHARGLVPVPVLGLFRDEVYIEECAKVVRRDHGVCVRLQREDFADFPDLEPELRRLVKRLSLVPANVHLLLDLRALTPETRSINSQGVLDLISQIPDLEEWRTFTLAATSFPENLIGIPPSESSAIRREEWPLWKEVAKRSRSRRPTFGDYGISHPEPSEVDPRIMRPSASVRYTTNGSWVILKARNLRDYGYEQFHEVCKELVDMEEYAGRDFSWGDGYIDDCASEIVGTGNLTTWRKVGTSHHLAFVSSELANLSGS